MSELSIKVLGPPRFERDGSVLHVTRRHAVALIVYLAVSGAPHHRDHLAAVLWPEAPHDGARGRLRRVLYDVTRTVGAGQLRTEGDTICLPRDPVRTLDIDMFHAAITACGEHGHPIDDVCPACMPLLTDAVDLYQDDFLAGFSLPDSPAFDDWQFFHIEALRSELALVLERLVRGHVARDQFSQAAAYARRWLALDPLQETVHRWLMQIYNWSGQQAAALRQYEHCRQLLADELGVPPALETDQLYAVLKAQRMAPSSDLAATTRVTLPVALPAPDDNLTDEIRVVTALSVGLSAPFQSTTETSLDAVADAMDHLVRVVNQACAPFGGQLERVAGEDVLVLFGVNQVHEDDAERAVRAAAAILSAADDMPVHIGIDTGMAYCRQQATGVHAVLGPVVSSATRLRNRAPVGRAMFGRSTFLATRGLCDTMPQQLAMPGKREPVPAYLLLKLRRRTSKRRGVEGLHAALIGREHEMAVLETALARARAGAGQTVAIVGEAGVGKSRLMEELKQRATRPTHDDSPAMTRAPLWLEGRCLQHAMNSPYWVFADLFQDLLSMRNAGVGALPADAPVADTPPAAMVVTLLHALEEAAALTHDEVEEIGPLLGWLLSLRFGSDWDNRLQQIDAEQIRRRLLAAIPRLLAALAARRLLVIVLEDLHWCDSASLTLIRGLGPMLAATSTLLLCVYRPEEAMDDWRLPDKDTSAPAATLTEIRVAPLTRAQSRQLVASLLAIEQLPVALHQELLDRAQGNPFFLEELIRSLIDRGLLYREDETWTGNKSAEPPMVPTTLQSVILNRVERLPASARQLLQAASVFGRIFRPQLLQAMELTATDLTALLAALSHEGFIFAERSDDEAEAEGEYSFYHVLVQETIYADLPNDTRVHLHGQAAGAIERVHADDRAPYIDQLAYHYDRSDAAEKAVNYLIQAGKRAEDAYLKTAAAANYERVLARLRELPPTPPWEHARLTALHGLGRVEASLGHGDTAQSSLRSAVDLAGALALPAREQADVMLSLAVFLDEIGDEAGQSEVANDALALLADTPTALEAVIFRVMLAHNYAVEGHWHRGMATLTPTIAHLRTVPHSSKLTHAYQSMVLWCRYAKQVDWGFAFIEEAAAQAEARHDYWSAGYIRCLPMLFLHEAVGNGGAIGTLLEAAEALAVKTGDEVLRLLTWYWQAVNFGWLQGQLDAAEARANQVLATRSKTVQRRRHIFADVVLGLVHFCRHEWEEAVGVLEAADRVATASQLRVDGVRRGRVGLAWTYAQLGRPHDGLEILAHIAREEELHIESWPTVACALAGLEPLCADAAEYAALRDRIIAARTEEPFPLVQWSLTPSKPDPGYADGTELAWPAPGDEVSQRGWTWHDQFGDCAYVVEPDGLAISAANYHDLWLNNFAAPHLLREVRGDWAVQAHIAPAYLERPALGGLLLWADRQNYLQLAWNTLAPGSIALLGCVHNVDGLFAVGRLPDASTIHLRLERQGDRVRALCSADGQSWFLVGEVEFPAKAEAGELRVGPLCIGMIHRYVHAGAFPQGAALRIRAFRLWRARTALPPSPESEPHAA